MGEKLEYKIVTDLPDFEKLRSVWNSLLEQAPMNRVFLTHEWFYCWWQAFGEGKDLFIVLINENNSLIGILPLMKNRCLFRGMPLRSIEFMANDDSPGCGFIIKKGYKGIVKSIISFLVREVKDWDIIFLKNFAPIEDYLENMIESCNAYKLKYMSNRGLRSPYIAIGCNWDSYFKNISSKSRKTLRNICNRVNRLGNVTIVKHKDTDIFGDIAQITRNSWKYRKGVSFMNRNDRMFFFKTLSDMSQINKWLSVWCLYKNGEPIAYEYHLEYRKVDTALLSDFNSDYSQYSPGGYLDYQIIKSLFNSEILEYDMCGSQDEYKKKWTNETRQYVNFMIFSDSIYSNLLYFIEDIPIKLVKKIRDKIFIGR